MEYGQLLRQGCADNRGYFQQVFRVDSGRRPSLQGCLLLREDYWYMVTIRA